MKLLVINGVNINMLGIRERELYGVKSYKDLLRFIKKSAKQNKVNVDIKFSNYEGEICEFIQKAYKRYDGIVLNAGAYTHTSIAILDSLKSVNIPTVEVHLTDVTKREEYRRISYVSEFASKVIYGKGFDGYKLAVEWFVSQNGKKN